MKKEKMIFFLSALIIVILDQFSKALVRGNMAPNQSTPLIKNILHISYITNTGSAFGLFRGMNFFFVFISIAVISFLVYFRKNMGEGQPVVQIGLGMILGGAAGNLIDRLLYGHVTDFIDAKIWPFIFNVADSAITIAAALLIFTYFRNEKI